MTPEAVAKVPSVRATTTPRAGTVFSSDSPNHTGVVLHVLANGDLIIANQQKSIKIPQETYVELNVLKNMQRLKFDYETIQFIVSQ